MPDISLSFTISALLVFVLIGVAVAIAFYFYRITVPPLPPVKKGILIALRSLALALLLLFLFEPLLRLATTSTQKPVLAVLIDASESMTITDNAGDRFAALRQTLRSNSLADVHKIGDVRYFTFGVKTAEVVRDSVDSLVATQEGSDLTSAIRFINQKKDAENIGAVVMITDGSYNLGQNPAYEAEQIGIPLFTVGVGDSTEQKDVLITKVVTNELVYKETEVPVDVTVKSSGYSGERVEVILTDGTTDLARKQVQLEAGTREYAARLSYIPEGEGVKKYTVRVSRLPGELTTGNNQRSFLARILRNKVRATIIGGTPSPDVTAVRQVLAEDRNIAVRSFTHKSGQVFYEGSLTSATLDSSDCLVWIGFPTSAVESGTVEMIRASVTRRTTPIFFIAGRAVDEQRLAALSGALPFTAANPVQVERFVFIEPSPSHTHHPVLATGSDEGIESWKRLPPVYALQTTYRAKAEASVLAHSKINSIVLSDPMILTRNVNRQKSLALLGYGVWRLRLMGQGSTETERLFATFVSNAVRWLTTRDDDRPVKVTTVKSSFTQGEPVEFTGQVYDATATPVEEADVTVSAESQGRSVETQLRPIGNGRYEGTLEGLGKGDYTFRAVASLGGQPLGDDKGRFSVGDLQLEFQDTRMNAQLLRQLAVRNGGKFYVPGQFTSFTEDLRSVSSFVPRDVYNAQVLELWNWKYMLALVVLLLAIEWFLRKRSGLL